MTVASKHPLYTEHLPDWNLLDVSYRGERVVKEEGTRYLPPTSGMIADGMVNANQPGYKAYQAYRTRAVFPEFLSDAVQTAMGMLWYKKPLIQVPDQLKPMLSRMSVFGEDIYEFLRRVHEQQLVLGRAGMLLDLPSNSQSGPVLPYASLYRGFHIINWDEGTLENGDKKVRLVVLDESENEMDASFSWTNVKKHRVLRLQDTNGPYFQEIYREEALTDTINPILRGQTLNEIPFVFVNSKDLMTEPDLAPFLGLARLCMTIYRGEADYRQNLFMQGQDTLVVIGAEDGPGESTRVGAGTRLNLPIGADAKYIGVESRGLEEQRSALENDRRAASSRSGTLSDTTSRQRESGDALQTRVAAQTATLYDIAVSSASGLTHLLKMAARWVGADEEQVSVQPNLDFINLTINSRNVVELQTAKNLGAPISQETIHKLMKERRMTELEFADELSKIKLEEPLVENPGDENPAQQKKEEEGDEGNSGGQGGSGRGTAGV